MNQDIQFRPYSETLNKTQEDYRERARKREEIMKESQMQVGAYAR
jgi:hypothetical protein